MRHDVRQKERKGMVKNLKQRKLLATREAVTHEFKVAGVKGYLTIGFALAGNGLDSSGKAWKSEETYH